jgi:hypothetical protein
MAEKRVAVFLKNGTTVVSEDMDEEAAQAEFERILSEGPAHSLSKDALIRVGKTAAFRSEDFSRIEIQEGGVQVWGG